MKTNLFLLDQYSQWIYVYILIHTWAVPQFNTFINVFTSMTITIVSYPLSLGKRLYRLLAVRADSGVVTNPITACLCTPITAFGS